MCGIFGVRSSWLASRTLGADLRIDAALASLTWRGRDSQRVTRLGDFVIGCARLSISNQKSHQPVLRRGGRYAAVLNGAITDARERWDALLPSLSSRHALPNDAWLAPLLVARGDKKSLANLRGHHALAVVDEEHGQLVLVRDRVGEKPLFVLREGGRVVAFASTTRALFALGIDIELTQDSTAEFFARGTTSTLRAVGPDLTVDDALAGVLSVATTGEHHAPPQRATGKQDLAAALLAATARCHDAEGLVALALSGGLDSSCLAASLQQLGARVDGYQFCAEGEPDEERRVAALVASHCGHRLRPVDGGPELLDALPQLTSDWGLPLGDPSVLALHALAKAAAQDGVRVLLSGEGSDEGLLGYARHRALAGVCWLRLVGLPAPRWSMRRGARLWRAVAAQDPFAELLAVTPPAFRHSVLAPSFAVAPPLSVVAVGSNRLERARAIEQQVYLRRDLLPKLDVATMAAQIEGRCPFLDAEVLATMTAIPAATALGKAPLRAAFRKLLPRDVLRAKKRGFGLPLDRWFRGPLPCLDVLRDVRTRERLHLRANGLDRAIDRHRSGRADLGHALYLVLAYEYHLRAKESLSCT
ncbi:MAG: asparagine synthase-related protein [Planctomycetota bacterium]